MAGLSWAPACGRDILGDIMTLLDTADLTKVEPLATGNILLVFIVYATKVKELG